MNSLAWLYSLSDCCLAWNDHLTCSVFCNQPGVSGLKCLTHFAWPVNNLTWFIPWSLISLKRYEPWSQCGQLCLVSSPIQVAAIKASEVRRANNSRGMNNARQTLLTTCMLVLWPNVVGRVISVWMIAESFISPSTFKVRPHWNSSS